MSITKELEKNISLLISFEASFDELIKKLEPVLKIEDDCKESWSGKCADSNESQVAVMLSIRNDKLEILNKKMQEVIASIDL